MRVCDVGFFSKSLGMAGQGKVGQNKTKWGKGKVE
jgi:hypothetical protein